MIEFTGERGCTRLPLNWPDHFAPTPRVVRKGGISIVHTEKEGARMSRTMNSPEKNCLFWKQNYTGAEENM